MLLSNDRCMGQSVLKREMFRSCSTLTRWSISLQYIDKVVVQDSDNVGRPLDLAATSSSIFRRQWEVPQILSSMVLRRFLGASCAIFRTHRVRS